MAMDRENTVGQLSVIGVDLAYKRWSDIGTALLSFTTGARGTWWNCQTDVVTWPSGQPSPERVAEILDQRMLASRASALSIDGPQGWRDPDAKPRMGVGRLCECETKTPGKTGTYGVTFPGNYVGWTSFSIALFRDLLARPHVMLANSNEGQALELPPQGRYYVLECFPTSTWRASGLLPLPGHRNAPPPVVETRARELQRRYGLPQGSITSHHDHLQATVAALPAAGLLGGPCTAVPRGEPGRYVVESSEQSRYWVEGIIWDAVPR